jgi:hypothetical protein
MGETLVPTAETRVYECAPRFARAPESFAHHPIQNAAPPTTYDNGATND